MGRDTIIRFVNNCLKQNAVTKIKDLMYFLLYKNNAFNLQSNKL